MKRSVLSLSLAAAVLTLSASTAAQQLRVPQDFETIQEALDSINVTQVSTITISAGTYRENPVMASGLNGLTVQGKGKVFIDALDGDDGFTIGSSNVTLKNLTIRHAGGNGVDQIMSWAPGQGPTILPDDVGIEMAAGQAVLLSPPMVITAVIVAVLGLGALQNGSSKTA